MLCFLILGVAFGLKDTFNFSENPENIRVINGGSVLLKCAVKVDEGLIFHWQQDGVNISNTTRRLLVDSNLLIRRVDHRIDPGEYSCLVTNITSGVTFRSRITTLNVQCKY